jgi:hypothetical protein
MRAGSNPLLIDIARREVIHLECKCRRQVQVAPYRLIYQYDGVRPTTPVWGFKEDRCKCKVCKIRPPKRM